MPRSLCLLLTVAIAFLLATSVAGQSREHRRYSKSEVERWIRRVEENGNLLKKYVDSDVDKTRLNGTKREDHIWEQVKELEEATNKLREHFDRTDRWEETRSEVQMVMREGRDVGNILNRYRISDRVQYAWKKLRHELNSLALCYDLPLLR
ncbi:MAG TPA: hypothetical protein VKM94_01910 [Blastocatellia bacterium]|nr:hypothetical protein [Blastocatellia bacterium]